VANEAVTVVATRWHGNDIVTLTYRTADGRVHEELVYRDQEPTLFVSETGPAFSFDGDGDLFRRRGRGGSSSPTCSTRCWP
jgi:hypothetical protein